MAEMATIWLHGHAVEVEYPERLAYFRRTAAGTFLDGKAGTENWVQIAIPTPETVNEYNFAAGSIFLRFKTGSQDAYIKDVHLYDGEQKIAEFNQLNMSPHEYTTERFDPPLVKLKHGLGITVHVEFGSSGTSRRIDFSSAGVVFTSMTQSGGNKSSRLIRRRGKKTR